MSQVNIEVIDAEYADVPKKTGKGTYGQLTVTFKNEEGKVEAKKLFDFAASEELFMKLKVSKKGDTFAIVREKNDKGYWDWKEIATQTAPVGKPASGGTYTKPTYETPDERAQRQVYIIKQSSLGHALTYLDGKDVTPAEVMKLAQEFTDFVLSNRVQDTHDDVPE